MIEKRKTKEIHVGKVMIGGKNPPVVQSMTKTDTRDKKATIQQIHELEELGCEIIRVAVLDQDASKAIKEISKAINIPLIADIHFDPRLAIESIKAGAKGIRINPGNIGGISSLKKIVEVAKAEDSAIRIGVNSGSVEKELLKKYGGPVPDAMVESALNFVKVLEDLDFTNFKISLKSSNVLDTIEAYERISQLTDYPLHIGITETGTLIPGTVKSSIGLGILLMKGIGDTIRVSLCSKPHHEVIVAYEILKALKIRKKGPEIIACPTCGRCEINLMELAEKVEASISHLELPIKVAVMGCVVNGPGEAKEADIGIAGGRGVGIIFKKGRLLRKVKEEDLLKEFLQEIMSMKAQFQGNTGREQK